VNAVKIFLSHLERRDMDPGLLHDKTIVAVGPKTAQAIADHGLQVDLIPEDFRAEGIIEVLSEKVAGKCVLYPKAGLARDLIPRQLRAAGAMVLDPVAYTSGTPADAAEKLAAAIRAGLDLLTFTASSTVHNLVKLIGPATLEQARLVPVASIGPLTSQTAREYGFKVVVEPEESTLDSLVEAIKAYFEAFSSKS
jgi:uroporphyrinogen III methyltransferase/synthase